MVVSERIALRQVVEQGWKELREQVLEQLKKTIEGLLLAERDRRMAERKQRGEKVYRWGYTVRKGRQTLWGELRQVRVPRLRGREEIGLLEKYQRQGLDEALFALAVGGLSRRKAVGWVRKFVGATLSPATIGAVLEEAEREIRQRRQRSLSPSSYRALVVDGVYLHYRRRGKGAAPKGVLLVAVGVQSNGRFEVLDWQAAESESAEAYEQLFQRLFERGLETVELIVSDGLDSITAAAQIVYPAAAHQLCLTHGFHAPLMVEKFQAQLNRVLAYLRWPLEWRHRLRTTNSAEGFFRHLRRYLGRFPGCRDAAHSEHVLGCYVLAAEQMHA